jgi:hypothetical protein
MARVYSSAFGFESQLLNMLAGGYVAIFYRCVRVLNTIQQNKDASCGFINRMTYLYGTLIILFLITSLVRSNSFLDLHHALIGENCTRT